jgi:hypothetical protein
MHGCKCTGACRGIHRNGIRRQSRTQDSRNSVSLTRAILVSLEFDKYYLISSAEGAGTREAGENRPLNLCSHSGTGLKELRDIEEEPIADPARGSLPGMLAEAKDDWINSLKRNKAAVEQFPNQRLEIFDRSI